MAVLCAVDFNQDFSLFQNDYTSFINSLSTFSNCTVSNISSDTNGLVILINLSVTTVGNIQLCNFRMSNGIFSGVRGWNLESNSPRNIKDLSLSVSGSDCTVVFSSFEPETFEMNIQMFL